MRLSLHKYKLLWSVGVKVEVQVFKKEFHIYIHLDYTRIENFKTTTNFTKNCL